MMRTDGGASEQATSYLTEVLADAQQRLDSGDADRAAELLDLNIARARQALAFGPQGILQRALGDLHRIGGRMDAACTQYDQAAAALHEAGDTAAEADVLLRRGDAQRALQRGGAATQSYTAAAALYESLDDLSGAARGEFLLAELAAGVHKDIAEQHYRRAIDLYGEAAAQQPDAAPLAADAEVPESVVDPRPFAANVMAEVAQRGLERLHTGRRPAGADAADEMPPGLASLVERSSASLPRTPLRPLPAPVAEAPFDSMTAAILLAAVALGFCGLILLAVQWTGHTLAVGVFAAVLAAGVTFALVNQSSAVSPYLKYGASGLAALLLFASGALPSLRPAPSGATAPLTGAEAIPTAAVVVRLSEEEQRAEFKRQEAEFEVPGDPHQQADVLRRFGEFESSHGAGPHARELLARSYDLYLAAAVPAAAGEVATQMGDMLMRTQRPEPARQRYDAAARLYTAQRDATGYSRAVSKRGTAEARLSRWSDAHASYSEALALVQRLGDLDGEIRLTLQIAATEQALARPQLVRPLLDQALRLSTNSGTPMQARVWLAVADFEASLDRDGPALRAYERAVTLAGAARDPNLEARGLCRRGNYERRRGRLTAARGTYEVAIRLAHAREAWSAEALSRVHAAELAVQMRDPDAARAQYADAEALYAEHMPVAGASRVAIGLGDLEASRGQVDAAQARYAEALELATQADHAGLQITALDRLTTLLAAKQPQIADGYLQRAAALRAAAFGPAAPHDEV
ncbi:MAG: hypothetical protein ABI629_17070 [bacterium]